MGERRGGEGRGGEGSGMGRLTREGGHKGSLWVARRQLWHCCFKNFVHLRPDKYILYQRMHYAIILQPEDLPIPLALRDFQRMRYQLMPG